MAEALPTIQPPPPPKTARDSMHHTIVLHSSNRGIRHIKVIQFPQKPMTTRACIQVAQETGLCLGRHMDEACPHPPTSNASDLYINVALF